MTLEEATPNMRVRYIPGHVHDDRTHPDCELGNISSVGRVNIFVKFDKQVSHLGWQGTIAQSCTPSDLEIVRL